MGAELTAQEWERFAHSRKRLLIEGAPASGRVEAGKAAFVLGVEMALAGVDHARARRMVVEGMPFVAASTPEHVVRRRTLPSAFETGYARGLAGVRLGCVCTWSRPERRGLYHVLKPYCEGSCFGSASRVEPWMVAVLASLRRGVERDTYWLWARHSDAERRFWCSTTFTARGLNFVYGLRSIERAYVHLAERGLFEMTGELRGDLRVPGRRLVCRAEAGEIDGGLVERGRVEASAPGLRSAWCALGPDCRDVYGLAAAGVAQDAECASEVLSWLPRRRINESARLLVRRRLLSPGGQGRALPVPPDVQAEGEAVAALRLALVNRAVDRGQERLAEYRKHGIPVLLAA